MHLYELHSTRSVKWEWVSPPPGDLKLTIRVGEPVAVRCSDNSDFYRTVLIRKNQFSNSYQALISNPVAATIPPGMDEVPQEQVFKRIRDLNAAFTSGSDLRAFPHKGAEPGERNFDFSVVTPLHQQQQKRGQRWELSGVWWNQLGKIAEAWV